MPRAKFAKMSVEELKNELLRRQRTLPQLIARREALDRQIAELRALGEAQAALKRAGKKPEKKRARKAQGRMRPACLADKLAEVFQGKESPSLAEALFLAEKNRFRAALGVFNEGPALKLSDENAKERAAPSTYAGGSTLHLADENGKVVWSQS
jgi:hypothetical protein